MQKLFIKKKESIEKMDKCLRWLVSLHLGLEQLKDRMINQALCQLFVSPLLRSFYKFSK
jgi:hypothetical protein